VQLVPDNPLGLEPQVAAPPTIFDRDDMRAPGLPRRHLIGSGPELSQQVVMIVYPQENANTGDGAVTELSSEITPPYYWRSLTYDKYTGRGWITVETETHRYQAGDLALHRDSYEPVHTENQVIPDDWLVRRKVQLEVRAVGDWRDLVHTAGDLVTIDQNFRIAWRSSGDAFGASLISTDRAPRTERIPGEIMEGSPTIYQVDSLVPVVGEAQLRAAGSDYPAWVEYRYLALPDNIPPRVLALARDLTATAPAPYDRALAIEKYLRTFPYNLDLPFPPSRRDIVDYFLFDLQEGYCDYYATSMVVLARAAGLPTRLAVGYASGTYDEANARYLVTEADAHAWVEIYFPGYGWIEFEPTAGRPPIERPADASPIPPPDLEDLEPKIARAGVVGLWWLVLLGMIVLLGLGGIIWLFLDSWRLRRLPPKAAVAELYWRFYRQGRRLAVPARPGDTPYEFVESFAERLMRLAGAKGWRMVLTPAAQEARSLAELYVRTCYGPDSPDAVDRGQMMSAWRRLRWRLWLARVSKIGRLVSDLTAVSSRPARRVEHLPTG
jgi:transglutaminase-like putative cysteine protease